MATETKFIDCPHGVWTLLADGSEFAKCGLQADGAVLIAVAPSEPDPASGDAVVIRAWPVLELTLDTEDKVYGRPSGIDAGGVRLYRTEVAA